MLRQHRRDGERRGHIDKPGGNGAIARDMWEAKLQQIFRRITMARVERRDEEPKDKNTQPEEQQGQGFKFTRRQFMVSSGVGAAGIALSGLAGCSSSEQPAATPSLEEAAAPEPQAAAAEGWGMQNYPYPEGPAYIEVDEMKCVGCGICEMACSMNHYGVINKDLARIQVRKYLLPLPKAVQVTCVQCPEQERECQNACPVEDGPAIRYDEELLHMVVDEERCLGEKCDQCIEACTSGAVRRNLAQSPYPFTCNLCDVEGTGERDPQCINVCPTGALVYKSNSMRFGYLNHDIYRKHPDEKAELIAKRMYPLTKESMGYPGWGKSEI
jgi:carbon-monoxide dehydrogenase iron sulfur subunit